MKYAFTLTLLLLFVGVSEIFGRPGGRGRGSQGRGNGSSQGRGGGRGGPQEERGSGRENTHTVS